LAIFPHSPNFPVLHKAPFLHACNKIGSPAKRIWRLPANSFQRELLFSKIHLMLTIYHNPRCSKSRAGLNYLKDNQIEYQIVEYLKEPLKAGQLKKLLQKLNMSPMDIVRTREDAYKKHIKGKDLSDEEIVQVIEENPRLIKRPVVEAEDKAVIAQPPSEIDRLL